MKFILLVTLGLVSISAFSATDSSSTYIYSFVYGSSAPSQLPIEASATVMGQANSSPTPSRKTGGQMLNATFFDSSGRNQMPLQVSGVRLLAYSKSGSGKILVRGAVGTDSSNPATPQYVTSYDGLVNYVAGDGASNYQGNVMLSSGQSVEMRFNPPVLQSQIRLQIEGFSNDDATVIVQIKSSSWPVGISAKESRSDCQAGDYLAAFDACCATGTVLENGHCDSPNSQPPVDNEIPCNTNNDCPSSFECVQNACVFDTGTPQCRTDADCPGGWTCSLSQCVQIP